VPELQVCSPEFKPKTHPEFRSRPTKKKKNLGSEPSVVMHGCHLNTQEAETGES
jgi:hypothetical protein